MSRFTLTASTTPPVTLSTCGLEPPTEFSFRDKDRDDDDATGVRRKIRVSRGREAACRGSWFERRPERETEPRSGVVEAVSVAKRRNGAAKRRRRGN